MFWVAGQQIDPGDVNLNGATTPWVTDADVRSFHTWVEANAHAAGASDHLGILPGPTHWQGTWLRFHDTELNILGESHNLIDLLQVKGAVEANGAAPGLFTYEPFATDILAAGSALETAYDAENLAEHHAYGIHGVADKRPYGGESLYPKIGFMMVPTIPYLMGTQPLADLRQAQGYLGQPVQRYMKLAWALAKDVEQEVQALNLAGNAVPPAKAALAQQVANHTGTLDGWLDVLPVNGWLGDALDPPPNGNVLPAMATVAGAVLQAIIARIPADNVLSPGERNTLTGMPKGNPWQLYALLLRWRDMHFTHVVGNAVATHRYSGMGSEHLNYLRAVPGRLPAHSRSFYMNGDELYDFATETVRLQIIAH